MKLKRMHKVFILFAGLFVLSSCTASFCSEVDVARMMYAYDSGLVRNETDQSLTYNPGLQAILDDAEADGIDLPSQAFWLELDERVLIAARAEAVNNGEANLSDSEALLSFGYVKYLGPNSVLWSNWTRWVNEIKLELPLEETPNRDFTGFYQSEVDRVVAT